MSEPIWKLMPKTVMQDTQVVWRQWPDGKQESCTENDQEYLKWIAEGNQPQPAEG